MTMTASQALELVPASVPNREALARLLVTVESARVEIESSALLSGWHSRFRELAALVLQTEIAPKGTQAAREARRRLYRAVDAARNFARRNGLAPDTYRDVLAEARATLDTMRQVRPQP